MSTVSIPQGAPTVQGRTQVPGGDTGVSVREVSFTRWLRQQRQRWDAIGDLARDQQYDSTWPKGPTKTLPEYLAYVRSQGACDDAEETLVAAWYEWRRDPTPTEAEICAVLWPLDDEPFAAEDMYPDDRDDPGALVYSVAETQRIATALYRKAVRKVHDGEGRNNTAFWLGRQLDSLGMMRREVVEWVVGFGKEVEYA